jgi:DNA-binding XRE family transcriptional regulator
MTKKRTVRRTGERREARVHIDPRVVSPEVGWRLRLLRYVFGNYGPATTQTQFAAQLGIYYQTYNSYENGRNVRLEIARKIIAKLPAGHGVIPYWLYDGADDLLPRRTTDRIKDAEAALSEERATRLGG